MAKEKQDIEFMKSKLKDFIKYKLNPDKFDLSQIEIIFKKFKNFDEFYKKVISYKCFSRIERLKSFQELFLEFRNNLKIFNEKIDKKLFFIEFDSISQRFKKITAHNKDEYFFTLQKIIDCINGVNFDCLVFSNLISLKGSVFEFLGSQNMKKAFLEDSFESFRFYKFLLKLQKFLYPIIKEASDFDLIFERISLDSLKYLDEMLDQEEILSFDKMQKKMLDSLKIDNFLNAVRYKYTAAIIDEFQDTDFIQFDIFKKVFLDHKKTLAFYLIGDAKQSIYSFRNADLYTYLNALEKFDNVYNLNTNYRSSSGLISSLNYLFSEFSKNLFKLPKLDNHIEYVPINAVKENIFKLNDNKKDIHFFISEDNKKKKWPTDKIEKDFFSFIASEILYLTSQKIDLSRISILVKDRYQANRLSLFFQTINIKNNVYNPSSLKASKALDELKLFFDAVLDPNDINKIKIALTTSFVGYNLNKINNLESFKKNIENFFYLKKIFLEKKIAVFFTKFFESKFDNLTILERIISQKKLIFYLDLLQIIDLFFEESNLNLNKIDSFFYKIKSFDEENSIIKRKSVFDEGVVIMTTHMSKGLEFDIVFALALASETKLENKNLEEIDAEKSRQLYVALTRSKYRTYIPIAIDIAKKNIRKGEASPVDLFLQNHFNEKKDFVCFNKEEIINALKLLKKNNIATFSYARNKIVSPFQEDKIILQEPKEFFYSNKMDSILSFSMLKKEKKFDYFEKSKESLTPIGSEIGNFYHLIFEKIFKNKISEDNQIFQLIANEAQIYGFENFVENIFLDVKSTINIPLFKEKGFCLKNVSFDDIYVEVEFLFPFENNFFKGFIDLIFKYKDKYYLLDWKSNFLGNKKSSYEKKLLEKAMIENNYFMQGSIYADALFKFLKNIKKIDPIKCFGGMFYVFLRGSKFNEGIYHFHPDISNLKTITSKI
ncbi:MAG: RecBCD enzyme subunit RecB [Candidatus Anoxychlamydiales bacterium]|nr:RecBCD enzyme subunit RecB [Candidatus Anoxychlamydiales bacterium]